jgi:hypothetical protein
MTKEQAIEFLKEYTETNFSERCIDAHDMAIKALEQQPCDDCVSRQAVLDLINADWKYEGLELSVNELPPVTPTQRWIPVSERLPECEGLYLVSVKNEHLRQYSKTCWFNSHRNWFSRQDVIAWQSLPKAYEE